MSKELQQNQQTVNGPEETSYLAPHVMPKVQSKIQPKVSSKIQAKLLNGAGEKKELKQQTSVSDKLPEDVQAKMENSFSQDFSNVNIHKDSSSAQDINAKAYTQGSDVHFAPGEYNPSSKEGQELIGHELTHVVQQGQGKVGPGEIHGKGLEINQDVSLEKEADDAGEKAANGQKVNSVRTNVVGNKIQNKPGDVIDKGPGPHANGTYNAATGLYIIAPEDTPYSVGNRFGISPDVLTSRASGGFKAGASLVIDTFTGTKNNKEGIVQKNEGQSGVDYSAFTEAVFANANVLKKILEKSTDWMDGNMHAYICNTISKPEWNFSASELGDLVRKSSQGSLPTLANDNSGGIGKDLAKQSTQEIADRIVFDQVKEQGSKFLSRRLLRSGVQEGASLAVAAGSGMVTQALIPIPGLGFFIGFTVAVLVDIASGLIIDKIFGSESEASALDAGKNIDDIYKAYREGVIMKMNPQHEYIDNECGKMIQQGYALKNQADLNLYVSMIQKATNKQMAALADINVGDRSLYFKMLENWLQSNVGEDADEVNQYGASVSNFEDANKQVNEHNGIKEDKDALHNHPEAFRLQIRAELIRFGIKPSVIDGCHMSVLKGLAASFTGKDRTANIYNAAKDRSIKIFASDIADFDLFKTQIKDTDGGWHMYCEEVQILNSRSGFELDLSWDLNLDTEFNNVLVEEFHYDLNSVSKGQKYHTGWSENL